MYQVDLNVISGGSSCVWLLAALLTYGSFPRTSPLRILSPKWVPNCPLVLSTVSVYAAFLPATNELLISWFVYLWLHPFSGANLSARQELMQSTTSHWSETGSHLPKGVIFFIPSRRDMCLWLHIKAHADFQAPIVPIHKYLLYISESSWSFPLH